MVVQSHIEDKRISLGVIKTGYIQKASSYGSKWKRRFIVLTDEAIHWFKRDDGYDLFGEERGHAKMPQILSVSVLAEDSAAFELITADSVKRFFKAENDLECQQWVDAISECMKRHISPSTTKKQDLLSRFDHLGLSPRSEESEVSIALASVKKRNTTQETVIARNVPYSRVLALPPFGKGDEVWITTTTGAVAILTEDTLRDNETAEEFECALEGCSQRANLIFKVTSDDNVEEVPRLRSFINLLVLDRHTTTMLIIAYMTLFSCLSYLFRSNFETMSLCVFAGCLSTYAVTFIIQRLTSLRVLREYALTIIRYERGDDSAQGSDSSQEDEMPQRFINGCMGDMREAKRRWDITKKWRKQERIDEIMDEPQPHFDVIKEFYPHYYCGRGKQNQPVYYESPGQVNMPKLHENGVHVDALVRHYVFMTEYLWNVLEKDDLQRTITVFDVTGVGLGDVVGEPVEFMRKAIAVVQEHYPERSSAICIINAPGWFSMIWKLVKPMVNEVTQQKIRILKSSEILSGLTSLIDIDQIPAKYGGTLVCGDGGPENARFQSPEELGMKAYVEKLNNRSIQRSMDSDSDNTGFESTRHPSSDLRKRNISSTSSV